MDKNLQAVADVSALTKPSASTASVSRWGLRLLRPALDNLAHGSLRLRLPDGSEQLFIGRSAEGPQAQLNLHSGAALFKLLFGGDVAFADAYADGHWSTPDLHELILFGLRNEAELDARLNGSIGSRWLNRLLHLWRDNNRRGSRRNIAFHYDLGNDFYRLWLDPGMSYSAALFDNPEQPLAQAQENKYACIRALSGARAGDRVLEIGCGWGGFMEHAARRGIQVHGVTLSLRQLDYANQRMQDKELAYQARATYTDYRDTIGQYDAIVSIEMLEAVGEAHWPGYFRTLHERLKPGGSAVVQVITIDEQRFDSYRKRTDFIQKYIFPGGMLPTPARLRQHSEQAGLVQDHAQSFGRDYAETLSIWRQDFLRAWPRIRAQGFDRRFKRLWEYYLCYCEAGFRHGSIDVGIYRFRRPA